MKNKNYYKNRNKKLSQPTVPKGEEGGKLRTKLVEYLDTKGNELSKQEQRRVRKGIQDINPNLYYVNVDGGYITYKKDKDGNFYQADDFGAGIYQRDNALSINRSGLAQSLTGSRKSTAYGGKENPKRVRDAITLAKQLGLLKDKSALGITEGNAQEATTETVEDTTDTNESGNMDLDTLIGTTPDNTVIEGDTTYAVIDGQPIPVILDADGKITAIKTLGGEGPGATFAETPQFDAEGNQINDVNPYKTGVSLFDEGITDTGSVIDAEGVETGGTQSTEADSSTFTDPRLFQEFLVREAKKQNKEVNGGLLGVKFPKDTYKGVSLDYKVGPKTLQFADSLGLKDRWKGTNNTSGGAVSIDESSNGETDAEKQARLDREAAEKLALDKSARRKTEFSVEAQEQAETEAYVNRTTEGGNKVLPDDKMSRTAAQRFEIKTPEKKAETATSTTSTTATGDNSIVLSGATYDLNKGKQESEGANILGGGLSGLPAVKVGAYKFEDKIAQAKQLDSEIGKFYQQYTKSNDEFYLIQLKDRLQKFETLMGKPHTLKSKLPSLKEGGKVPNKGNASVDMELDIQAKYNRLRNKEVLNRSDVDNLQKELTSYKSITGTEHDIQKGLNDLKEGIKIFADGGKNTTSTETNIRQESLSYLRFLDGKEGDTSQGFFKQGGKVESFQSGGKVRYGQPYRDSLTGEIVTLGPGYDHNSPTAVPLTPVELAQLNNTNTSTSTSTTNTNNGNLSTDLSQIATPVPTTVGNPNPNIAPPIINTNSNTGTTSTGNPAEQVDTTTSNNDRETGNGKVENQGARVYEFSKKLFGNNSNNKKGKFGLDHTTAQFLTALGINVLNSNKVDQVKPEAQNILVDTVKRNNSYRRLEDRNKQMFAGARARTNKTSDPTLNQVAGLALNSQEVDASGKLAEAEAADLRSQKDRQTKQRQAASAQRTGELNQSIAIDNQAAIAEDTRKDTLRSTLGNLGLQYADAKKVEGEQKRALAEGVIGEKVNLEANKKIADISANKAKAVTISSTLDNLIRQADSGLLTQAQIDQSKDYLVKLYNETYPDETPIDFTGLQSNLLGKIKGYQTDIDNTRLAAATQLKQMALKGALEKNFEYAPFSNPLGHLAMKEKGGKVPMNASGGTTKQKEKIKLQKQREKEAYKLAKEQAKAKAKQQMAEEKARLKVQSNNMKSWGNTVKQYHEGIASILTNIENIKNPNRKGK